MAGTDALDLHALQGYPGRSVDDATNRLMRDSVLSSKLRELPVPSCETLTDSLNLLWSELGGRASSVVGGVCDRFKVFWIDAIRNTTKVIQLKTFWNRPVSVFVRDSVRLLPAEFPVAVTGCRSLPDPARSLIPTFLFNPKRRSPYLWVWELSTGSVSKDIANWLTFYVAKLRVSLCCYRRRVSTSALAQSAGIGW